MSKKKETDSDNGIQPPANMFQRVMCALDDYVWGPVNLIDRVERIVTSIRLLDRGHQFAMLRIDRGGDHYLREVSDILRTYGIPIFGRTHNGTFMFFHVTRRQRDWAQFVLLSAGVKIYDKRTKKPLKGKGKKGGGMPIPRSPQDACADGTCGSARRTNRRARKGK